MQLLGKLRTFSFSGPQWARFLVTLIVLDALINLALLISNPALFLIPPKQQADASPAMVRTSLPTSTPFQPLHPTPTFAAPAFAVSATPTHPLPSTIFYGINFSPGAPRIKISIYPRSAKINRGRPIVIKVNPSSNCRFQDHLACISAFATEDGGNILFASVHSGIGGEAETYRRAVEGMGLDRAGFSLKLIRSNMASLEGASVEIKQGDQLLDGLVLTSTVRLPPPLLSEYFSVPAKQAFMLAASSSQHLERSPDPAGTALVFETCGWRLPGEAWAPGVTSTTGSVYLGLIQKSP
jgi:hypothetical protein